MRRFFLLASLLVVSAVLSLNAQKKASEPQWIWFDEGDPVSVAPAEPRWFRGVFNVDKIPDKAELEITADNGFVAWLNGVRVGEGDRWETLYKFDVRKHLKAGKNILAVEGRNDGGPAGLVAKLGDLAVTDKSWRSSKSEAKDWQKADFDDKAWKPVAVIGPFGKVGPWSGVVGGGGPDKPRGFKVPDGFKVEMAVKKPDNRGPFSLVNMCFDSKGRLLLSQEGGPTLLCTKPDKDGVYQEVADYCTLVKNSQGMCWVGDALLLVGDGPKGTGLYRCRDTKGVDKVDKVELLHAFQGGMGEHGPHAILHGPDGWLYVVVGNHAFAKPDKLADNSPLVRWPTGQQGPDQGQKGTTEDVLLPRLNDANGHAANIRAPGGTIWRMDHEGKNVSLFSAGYRNQFDAAFSPSGELFTFDSDMEWDEGLPWYRHVRVAHATPGSDFLWRTGAANTPNYYLDSLPPTSETGRGSPVGVEFYDHHAFPMKYHGACFLCDWSIGVIYAMHLKSSGASCKATVEKFCTGSPMNVTDCAVAPDGPLYFTLGGRGSQGGVYRIVPETKLEVKDTESAQPLSAWSREHFRKVFAKDDTEGGRQRTIQLLMDEIDPDSGPRARRDAGYLLRMAQFNGVALPQQFLERMLTSKNAGVRATIVWMLGVNGFKDSKKALLKSLADEDVLVRRRACEAMVRARIEPPIEALGPVLVDDDIFVRTAARLVLQRMDTKLWADRLWKTDDKTLLREGIVALCKTNQAAEHAEPIFNRLHEGSPGERVQDILDHLRAIQLALIHTGKRPGSVRGIALDCLEMFPHKDDFVNRELAIVLAQFRREKILDEPVHAKLLDAMRKAKDDRKQAIHYFYCLRLLHEGWTKEQKTHLLEWFETTRSWQGGASFTGFLANIFADLGPVFSRDERLAVFAKMEALPQSSLGFLRTAKADMLPGPAALAELLPSLRTAKIARAPELRNAIVEALGRMGTPEANKVLVKLVDQELIVREQVYAQLARNVNTETIPALLKALEACSKQSTLAIVQGLKQSSWKPKAEEGKPFRVALLAAPRLDPPNRWQLVELLRHWAGNKRFSAEDRDWKGELTAWAKWFGQTFPKEPSLPDVVGDKEPESKWKYAELLALVEKEKGDPMKGRAVFEKGQCFKCHKFGKDGEGLGPDLTTLSKRFKRADTLEALYYPSKVISDQYRSALIVTKKGLSLHGLAAPQGDTVTVLQADGTKTTLKKSDIDQQLSSLVSVMPEKLLDMLSKEEIADLFAFLESEIK